MLNLRKIFPLAPLEAPRLKYCPTRNRRSSPFSKPDAPGSDKLERILPNASLPLGRGRTVVPRQRFQRIVPLSRTTAAYVLQEPRKSRFLCRSLTASSLLLTTTGCCTPRDYPGSNSPFRNRGQICKLGLLLSIAVRQPPNTTSTPRTDCHPRFARR